MALFFFYRMAKSPEDILRENFVNMKRDPSAFSSISYLGTQTVTPPTYFKGLLAVIEGHLKNSTVRSARSLPVIFNALMVRMACTQTIEQSLLVLV